MFRFIPQLQFAKPYGKSFPVTVGNNSSWNSIICFPHTYITDLLKKELDIGNVSNIPCKVVVTVFRDFFYRFGMCGPPRPVEKMKH